VHSVERGFHATRFKGTPGLKAYCLKAYWPFALLFLASAGLTRVVLTLAVGPATASPGLWPRLFLLGFGFDLAVLAWLLAPLLLRDAFWPTRWRLVKWKKSLRLAWFFLATALFLFAALAEWTFWEEFATRFNFIAVDYLIYTHEVIGNIVESYPVGGLLFGIALLAAGLTWLFRRPIAGLDASPPKGARRLLHALLAFALPWAAWQLTDIDQMRFSENAYANELSGNGLMTFATAFQRNELEYERFYRTLPDADVHRILSGLKVEREPLSEALGPDESEAFDARRLPFKKPPRNVVLITVESLSADYLGAFGDKRGLTPRLDALIKDGMLYSRLYATGTRTVRGLEALSLGTPPIPGQAIVRRPGNEHLATVGEILRHQGYETLFHLWRLRLLRQHERLFRRQRLPGRRPHRLPEGVGGLRERLGRGRRIPVRQRLNRLDQAHAAGKPFLAQIMTTSNHRPYTYPDGRIDIPSPGKRERRGEIHRLRHRPLHRAGRQPSPGSPTPCS
jgi:phosphoglycerol transferase MdoB-like AlkP superfamily enzyme